MRDFDVTERRSTWLELFFDLCFAAAIATLADGLHSDPTLRGLLPFAGLFVVVWWAWTEFTWFSTAWDNDDLLHRLGTFTAMLLVIVLAATIPRVYQGNDQVFVLTYVGMHVLLLAMFVRVRRHAGPAHRFVVTSVAGIAIGALIMGGSLWVDAPLRYWVWAIAVIELMVTPVLAVRSFDGESFDSSHLPERYGLFTIIVLGESVVTVGVGLGEVKLDGGAVTSAVLGFGIAAAIWWSYFETVSSSSLSRERVWASFVWGYGHLFGFAGIAATAVGVDLAIEAGARADHGLSLAARLMLCAGSAAFLLSLVAVHAAEIGWRGAGMVQRWAAIGALLALSFLAQGWQPAFVVGAVFVMLVITVSFDVVNVGGQGLATDHLPDEERPPPKEP
ncbi:MAG: low temperature requirement protein A [Actinomycetota bacterium]|nr:low temperature requirement protein A [Actinomycetota bacterium]